MPNFTAYGGITLSGQSEPDTFNYSFSQQILWDTKAILEAIQTITWNTGPVTQYWWRVVGCCRQVNSTLDGPSGGCDVLPIGFQACTTPNLFVLNVTAGNVAEVCNNLRENHWRWPICSVQKFSRPIRASNTETDECNELITTEYCTIPECFEFCLHTDAVVKIGVQDILVDLSTIQVGYGEVTFYGSASTRIVENIFEGYGDIVFYGEGVTKSSFYSFDGYGDIILSGQASSAIKKYSFAGYGGIVLSGHCATTSPVYHAECSGGIILSGSGPSTLANYYFGPYGTIILGGQGSTRNSSGGNFWFVPYGGIALSGEGVTGIKRYDFSAYGNVLLYGSGETASFYIGDFFADIGASAILDDIVVVFNEPPTIALVPVLDRVSVDCFSCSPISSLLYLTHSLGNTSVFTGFLNSNGFKIDKVIPLRYSRKKGSWFANLHYTGLTNGASTEESWNFMFEWGCSNELAGDTLGTPIWEFSMLVSRKNLTTLVDYDTRMLVSFPGEICPINDLFDFSFFYNTQENYVKTNPEFFIDVYVLYDNIGLFKSNFWTKNPFANFYISETPVNVDYDIKSLDALLK